MFYFVLMRKDFLCREQAVECGWKAGIDGHLHDHFDDFLLGTADVAGSMKMHFQLGNSIAHCCERRDHGELPGPEIESWP